MRIYRRRSQFGWRGDHGLGERLIQQILAGTKTATACPRVLYSFEELRALKESVGHRMTVVDKLGKARCTILQLEVFETSFGAPDRRLVLGEGFKDAESFKRAHHGVWDDLLEEKGTTLNARTVLIVERFRRLGKGLGQRGPNYAAAWRRATQLCGSY